MSETPQGYQGPLPANYVQSSAPQTPNLGLTLTGQDPIIAYNFVLIDTAIGGGGGGGTPSLPFNSIQYNNAGAFGGSANLTFASNVLALSGRANFLHTSTATPTADFTLAGSGSGMIQGFPVILDLVQEDESSNCMSFRNQVAIDANLYGGFFYVTDVGTVLIGNTKEDGTDNPGQIVFDTNGNTILGGGNTAGTSVKIVGGTTGEINLNVVSSLIASGPVLSFSGRSTGKAAISVASAAGTPNTLLLPTTTGGSGNVLSTNGANPQQLSWVAAATGTVTSVTFTGDGTVLSSTPSGAVTTTGTLTAALANAAGGTVLGRAGTTSGAPAYTIAPHLGIPGTSTGLIALASATASGLFTLTAPASASTPTLTLPTTSNVLAGQFAGDGVIYSASLVTASTAGTLILPAPSNQNANIVFAGPSSGGAAQPTFRALVAADIPNSTVTPLWNNLQNATGALTLANGTNATTFNQTSAAAWTWANTTPTVVSLVLTQVTVSGATTTYTGTITGGGASAYAGASVTFAGFTNSNNNGTFVITSSTATTLVVTTVSQANETHAGTAVSSAAVASPILNINSTYTTGSASAVDSWTIQNVVTGVAANGASTLTFAHSGSSGTAAISAPLIISAIRSSGNAAAVVQSAAGTGTINFPNNSQVDFTLNSVDYVRFTTTFNTFGQSIPLTLSNGGPGSAGDVGLSRLGAASLAIGSGVAGDTTGNLSFNTIIKYGGSNTVGQGVASEIVTVDLTAQTAAITATNLTASAPRTGMYRITMSATITTAATTGAATSTLGGTNGFQIGFTSPTDSVAKTTVVGNSTTSAANTTGTAVSASINVYAKTGTAITYAFDYASNTAAQMAYELHVRLEAL